MRTTLFPPSHTLQPTPEQIAALAYQLHLGGGQLAGVSLEDWLCAEYLLTQSQPAPMEQCIAMLSGGTQPATKGTPCPTPSLIDQEPHFRKTPQVKHRNSSRPARQNSTALPPAVSASTPPAVLESPAHSALQPANHAQRVPTMTGAQLAIWGSQPSNRWRGINE